MRRRSCNSESGAILAIVIILMLALTITGIAFLNAGVMENRLVRREVHKNKAFYIAEGGLDRTIWNLKQDFVNSTSTPDWTDGDINEVSVVDLPGDDPDYVPPGDPDYPDRWRLLDYDEASLSLGDGVYLVKVKYVDKDEIWVKSTGTVKDVPRTVQVYVKVENVFPWNTAIFAGVGAAGHIISGNALIHGSVIILGEEGVGDPAMAMDTIGTSGMRNNYEGMPDGSGGTVDLVAKVPSLETVSFHSEPVESLEATLRVKHGIVGLSGNAMVGQDDEAYNPFKETMDGVYVSDGFGGNKGAINVYSDNGTGNPYDLGDTVEFPSLLDPYVDPTTEPSTPYTTYLDYLYAKSVHITGINEISSDIQSFWTEPSGSIHYKEENEDVPDYLLDDNYIIWNQENDLLTINGIIYIEGLPLSLDLGKADETIEYSGSGTIVVAKEIVDEFGDPAISGEIMVHGDLLAKGTPDSGVEGEEGFPYEALGLVTGRIELATGEDESQLAMTGAFFAENQIVSAKQNEIAGTFVCNYFQIEQVPSIYQVPELANNLPPGMPGGTPNWYITTSQWSES